MWLRSCTDFDENYIAFALLFPLLTWLISALIAKATRSGQEWKKAPISVACRLTRLGIASSIKNLGNS